MGNLRFCRFIKFKNWRNNMSDLISREALERRCKGSYLTPDDFRFEIRNAPAIEQGDVVDYIDEFGNFENSLKQWMVDEPDVKWDALYTTPQQPQSVADVLEEVLKILDGHIDRATTLGQQEEFREAQARIRALIKRNTEESE